MVGNVAHGFVGSLCADEGTQMVPQVRPQLSVLAANFNCIEAKESFSRLPPMLHDGVGDTNTRFNVRIFGASVGEDEKGVAGGLFELFVVHLNLQSLPDHSGRVQGNNYIGSVVAKS